MSRSRAQPRVEDAWQAEAKTSGSRRRLLARWQLPPPEGRAHPGRALEALDLLGRAPGPETVSSWSGHPSPTRSRW